MKSFCKVMVMGHLAADPEIRQTKNGNDLASFPLATNRFSRGEGGEKREVVDFHRVVVWKGLAGVCEKYLAKGSAVLIEGRLINRSFDDEEGNKHFRTEIVADGVNILTWKKGKGDSKEKIGLKDISDNPADVEIEEVGEGVNA